MRLELRVVDRGETRCGGLVPLRDVYLRDGGGQTLLYQCNVSGPLVKRIAEAVPGAVVIEEPFAGEPTDGAADRVAERDSTDADDGEDTDLYQPDAGEPVG